MTVTLTLGTPNQGTTGATSYTQASHQTDDILMLGTETNVTAGLSDPTTPTGCVDVTGSPRTQGSNVTCNTTWWKRAASGAESNFSVPATSDHQVGIPFRLRGCITSGDPWEVISNDGQATGTTGRIYDPSGGNSLTTISDDNLVVYVLCCSTDTTSDNFAGAITTAPTGLTSWTIHDQHFTTNGNGGGMLVASGIKATAGVVGPLNWTFTTTGAFSGFCMAFPEGAATPPARLTTARSYNAALVRSFTR
jgi:hypothetical protein